MVCGAALAEADARLVRCSAATPLVAMCSKHLRRLVAHECCPRCGVFCSTATDDESVERADTQVHLIADSLRVRDSNSVVRCCASDAPAPHLYHLECLQDVLACDTAATPPSGNPTSTSVSASATTSASVFEAAQQIQMRCLHCGSTDAQSLLFPRAAPTAPVPRAARRAARMCFSRPPASLQQQPPPHTNNAHSSSTALATPTCLANGDQQTDAPPVDSLLAASGISNRRRSLLAVLSFICVCVPTKFSTVQNRAQVDCTERIAYARKYCTTALDTLGGRPSRCMALHCVALCCVVLRRVGSVGSGPGSTAQNMFPRR